MAPRALLLGVTPELAGMRWPAGTSLLAVDRSPAMIEHVFPPATGRAVQGEWTALPCGDGELDVAVGDGSLTNLAFPGDYARLADELARVIRPGGRLALRLFAAPEPRETLAEVAADLRAGRIAGFHALKWRIAMAIEPDERDVPVAAILAAFDELVPDRSQLPWSAETIATIDVYRGSTLAYSFPRLPSVEAALAPRFAVASVHVPCYELGERCPTVVFDRR